MVELKNPTFPIISADFYTLGFESLNKKLKEKNGLKLLAEQMKWLHALGQVEDEFMKNDSVIIITDTRLRIVHATGNIFDMNGYLPSEIIGKSPKIFQGEKTDPITRNRISEAIKKHVPFEETILNYKKDNSIYKCWIKGQPIRDKKGKVVNFVAFEKKVA